MRTVPVALVMIVLAGCSTETAPIASRTQTVPRQLFGHAGQSGSGIVELAADSGADGGRPRLPTGTAGGAGRQADPAMADDAGAPDAGTIGSDAATDSGTPEPGVGVCGHCSDTAPCAAGLICVDEAVSGIAAAGPGQVLGKRCYIDCSDQAGKDTCAAQKGWCGYEYRMTTQVCPLQRSSFNTACRD